MDYITITAFVWGSLGLLATAASIYIEIDTRLFADGPISCITMIQFYIDMLGYKD